MSTPMDHIAYLSQEIGPRPAGTEEEQQAALYITERLQKDAHLSAQIEDFTCNSDALMTPIICYAAAFVAILLGVLLPVVAIPAAIISLAAVALIALELFDHPVVSQLFMKGVSQNVVAKYEPTRTDEAAGSRRRKVIIVANYDSGKVRRETFGVFVRALRPLRYASFGGTVIAALLVLIRSFSSMEGAVSIVFAALAIICAIPAALQLAFALMEKFAPFVEAANNNASGVSVMLEVARRLGNGEVSADAPISTGEEISFGGIQRTPTSVSDNLVQLKEDPISSVAANAVSEGRDRSGAVAAAGTLAEAAAKAQALSEEHAEAAQKAAAEEAILAQKAAEEARILEEERAKAEQAVAEAASVASNPQPASVPDWYRKATEKAREKKAESGEEAKGKEHYRSRFADYPTGEAEESALSDSVESPVSSPEVSADPQPLEAPKPSADMYALYSSPAPTQDGSVVVDDSEQNQSSNSGNESALHDFEPEVEQEEATAPQDQALPSASPAAETTRLPQMMYYVAPADRSAVQAERAQKERVVVQANDDSFRSSESASGLVGMQAYEAAVAHQHAGQLASVPQIDIQEENAPKVISPNIPVVDLPRIELPTMTPPEPRPISFSELRQRAPLAENSNASAQASARSSLSAALPSINASTSQGAYEVEPSTHAQNANVSLTGSFAAIESIGAEPVGDELLEGLNPEDIYIDDADDSVFQEEFTEMGAYAGTGYVEMPQSRVGKFFGKFRRKKNNDTEESAQEWLGVDESFDARSVGKARGSWESFRDDDDWEGGAFSNLRARIQSASPSQSSSDVSQSDESIPSRQAESEPVSSVSSDSYASAYEAALRHAEAASEKIETEDDIHQIYSFAAGDINTEVWFVALGSELADNGGIKAFLAAHASEMRGAIVLNLEALGSGTLSYLDHEGDLKQVKCSPRMKRFIKKASQASGVQLSSSTIDWRESPASYAAKHRVQTMTLVGMDGFAPAHYAQADDVLENINQESLNASADFVVELLKNI